MIVDLNCDILCSTYNESPIYRLWFDDLLIAERKYICKPQRQFIREKCQLDIESGSHKIKLEAISNHIFTLHKTKINGRVIAFTDANTAIFKL